jgi:hypothetical protein
MMKGVVRLSGNSPLMMQKMWIEIVTREKILRT